MEAKRVEGLFARLGHTLAKLLTVERVSDNLVINGKWNVGGIIGSERVQQMIAMPNEVSVALYVGDRGIVGSPNFDKQGTAETVQLPDVHVVVEGCRINKTNKVILMHNHPFLNGGYDCSPSDGDIAGTLFFRAQLAQHGVELVDHLIVSKVGYFSFKAAGML